MENQKILQAMFLEATIGILVVNARGQIVKANPFSEKLFAYEKDELISKPIEILLPDSFRKRHVTTGFRRRRVIAVRCAYAGVIGIAQGAVRIAFTRVITHLDKHYVDDRSHFGQRHLGGDLLGFAEAARERGKG